jgi:hypothetical protein
MILDLLRRLILGAAGAAVNFGCSRIYGVIMI